MGARVGAEAAEGFAQRVVYLDHAATSWPKPPEVVDAVSDALVRLAGNPGRAAHRGAIAAARVIESARHDVAAFLGVKETRNLLFQPGCTQALNLCRCFCHRHRRASFSVIPLRRSRRDGAPGWLDCS